MKVKELKRLLSYFSDEIEVEAQDNTLNELIFIENVRGEVKADTGQFIVRLDIRTGKTTPNSDYVQCISEIPKACEHSEIRCTDSSDTCSHRVHCT